MSFFKIKITGFLIVFNCSLFSQPSFDFKAGAAINYGLGYSPFVEFQPHDHGGPIYPYLSYNSSTKTAYASPYLSIGTALGKYKFFEWHMGLSFLQYRQSILYYSQNSTMIYNQPTPFNRTISSASGQMVYNIFRYELAPTIKVGSFKINFGILNVDFLLINANNLNGTASEYKVIPNPYKPIIHQYSGNINGYQDSLVTLTNTENIKPTYSLANRLSFPFSFGLEQNITTKKHTYLLGTKIVSSFHKNYYKQQDMLNYYQVLFYIGAQISSKTSKKETPVESK